MVIVTAIAGDNSDLFKQAATLYLSQGQRVLDMTYGNGVFWRKLDTNLYDLVKNDLDEFRGDIHVDFRNTYFNDEEFDAVVLDPPYASRSSNKNSIIGSLYNNKNHHLDTVEDMLKFYRDGMIEALRILKKGGILFVKCMDEISGGKQRRNHFDIWKDAISMGFIDEDLFILMNPKTPIMRHEYQLHARKNNSFLWVFKK